MYNKCIQGCIIYMRKLLYIIYMGINDIQKSYYLIFLNKSMLLNCLSKSTSLFSLNSSSKLSEICPEDKLKT